MNAKKEIGIGMIGAGYMSKAHTTAFQNMPFVFEDVAAVPRLEIIADTDEKLAKRSARNFKYNRWTSNWRAVIEDPKVDIVDITTPNYLHAEMAIAAAKAGKHIYCEKPLAINAEEAKAIVSAVEHAGVSCLVGFNYLKNPIQAYARQLIQNGELGEITLFRGAFDQDILTDAHAPFSWRFDRKIAGAAGTLGDLGSHSISLALFLVDDIVEVSGIKDTFIKQRPIPSGGSGYRSTVDRNSPMRAVENEDIVQFLFRFKNGALGTIGSSRIGTGRKIGLSYEIQGTKGSIVFTQDRMNELQLYRHTDPEAERGFKTVTIAPEHPGYGAFFPVAGIPIGYNDLKIVEVYDLITAIVEGKPVEPDAGFGYKVNQVMDAVIASCASKQWVRI